MEREEDPFCSSSVVPFLWHFHLCLRGFYHQIVSMAEEEEALIAVDVKIVRKSLLPLQDPWYSSSPLFFVVLTDISASNAPCQWNIRGEALNPETTWVPSASGVMDLCLQRKELLPLPVQFWCPSGLINNWSNWLDKEIRNEEFFQALRDANIFEAVLMS